MSDDWNRVSMAQEGFEESVWSSATHSHDLTCWGRRNSISLRLITLLSATIVLGMSACTSKDTPTEASASAGPELAAVKTYTAVDLGTLPECCPHEDLLGATAINPADKIVGSTETVGSQVHAFLWDKGIMSDLGTLGGIGSSRAAAINPAGQVVGASQTASGDRAFLWEKGVMTDLGTLGGTSSSAAAINPAGQVVGESQPAPGALSHAFLWEKGIMTDLGTLGGRH